MSSTWKLKDGKEMLISDMSISHIENCMELLKKQQKRRLFDFKILDDLEVFDNELEKRKLNSTQEESEANLIQGG